MAYPLEDVLADPAQAARHIEHDKIVFGGRAASGRSTSAGHALLELTLEPQRALAAAGFQPERVRVAVLREQQALTYVLSGRDRQFKHRNAWPSRSLCLFYVHDDPALTWMPQDGLGDYLTIVRRHLVFEEQWRRTGDWPCEDTPHGPAALGGTHPVVTRQMRALAHKWARLAA